MKDLPLVVLVHGAWHGSWCWAPVTTELAARGVASVAIDLEGHGLNAASPRARWARPYDAAAYASEPSPLAAITASSAAKALNDQLRALGGGRPCVVVAHSLGGAVTALAAEQAPELVSRLVYVSAVVPVNGQSATDQMTSAENADSDLFTLAVADPAAVGALRIDTGGHEARRAVAQALYHDVRDETAAAATALLSVDAPVGLSSEPIQVSREHFGAIHHTYVMCTADRVVRPALQSRVIRDMDAISSAPTTVIRLSASHSPFMSMPDALSRIIMLAAEANDG